MCDGKVPYKPGKTDNAKVSRLVRLLNEFGIVELKYGNEVKRRFVNRFKSLPMHSGSDPIKKAHHQCAPEVAEHRCGGFSA